MPREWEQLEKDMRRLTREYAEKDKRLRQIRKLCKHNKVMTTLTQDDTQRKARCVQCGLVVVQEKDS